MMQTIRGRSIAAAIAVSMLAAGVAVTGSSATAKSSGSSSSAMAAPALFTTAQASMGEKAFGANCSACHGEHLEGGAGPALTGGTFVTLAKNTKLTVGDLYTFISQQMPLNAPASLSAPQYSAIMAYILKFNGYPSGSKTLTANAAKASKVPIHPKA